MRTRRSLHPGWTLTPDTTAAGGARLQNADAAES